MSRGFKAVTPENWLDPDPLSGSLVKRDRRDGSIHPVDGRDWIAYVNAVPLSPEVPQKVRDAYDFAIGAVGYGYFYYPIFTLVVQQVLRIADFAVAHLFVTETSLPKPKRRTFEARLDALKIAGHLDESGFEAWNRFRRLRNSSTHPDWQQTWGHAALEQVRFVSELISALPWPPNVSDRQQDA
jgi:hypothetical protein